MRFPSRLLAVNAWLGVLMWAGFVVIVGLITVGFGIFATVSRSAWELAASLPRWYALFVGVTLVYEFLPLYLGHGQTRRQFAAQAGVTVGLLAPLFAALLVVGYLLEALLYNLAGWPQTLNREHLFSSPTQVPLVFAEHLVQFLAWLAAGALIGAGFYRWRAGGLLTVPVGLVLVLLAESAIGSRAPWIGNRLSLDLPQSPGLALALGLGTIVVGLALSWSVVRDVPLRNRR
jgi:hypothetical protein